MPAMIAQLVHRSSVRVKAIGCDGFDRTIALQRLLDGEGCWGWLAERVGFEPTMGF